MLQQITIQSESELDLKPLLETAILGELRNIQHGINRTRARLEAFEKQYGMTTDEFLRRFTPDDLGETLDFLDWHGETKMLALLEEKKKTLEGLQVK
ncbi:MAG TPA: hypothetical protein VFZ43_04515 [Anaerolineales bacterium]